MSADSKVLQFSTRLLHAPIGFDNPYGSFDRSCFPGFHIRTGGLDDPVRI